MKSLAKTILFISFEANLEYPNAQTNHTLELAKALSDQGCQTTVITSGTVKNSNSKNFLHIPGDNHEILGSKIKKIKAIIWKNINIYRIAKKHIKESDVIYERHHTLGIVGLLLAWRYRKPLYYEVNSLNGEEALYIHGMYGNYISKAFNKWLKFQLRQSRAVFVQTIELQDLVRNIYELDNVAVVPNGAALTARASKVHKAKNMIQCLYVGAMDDYHSLESILDIFGGLKKIAHLTVIGGGPNANNLKDRYSNEVSNITFSGYLKHDEVLRRIKAFDIGLAPYNIESPLFKKYGFYFCPMKLMEYSAAALPTIIVGASNSLVSVFEDSGACLVVKKPAGLKKELERLYAEPDTLSRMSAKALATGRKFTWHRAAQSTLEVFNA